MYLQILRLQPCICTHFSRSLEQFLLICWLEQFSKNITKFNLSAFQKKFFTIPKFWKTDENGLGNEESQPSLVKRNSGALNTLDTS